MQAEMAILEVTSFSSDLNRIDRIDGDREKQGAMVLATVEAMTEPDSVWSSGSDDADTATQATTVQLQFVHKYPAC